MGPTPPAPTGKGGGGMGPSQSVLMSIVIRHRRAHDFRRRKAVDFGFRDEPGLQQFFADGDAFCDGVDAELASAIVANPLDHGGDERRRGSDARTTLVDVRFNAVDALVRHHEAGFLKHFKSVEEAIRDEREERIELEVPLADGIRNRRIMPDDEHTRLNHGFGNDGIDFSGHDGASGLSRRQRYFADAGLRPRRHEAQVGGNLEKRGRTRLENPANVREIVEVLRPVDEIVRLNEVDARLFGERGDDRLDVFVGSADASADGCSAEVDSFEGFEPAGGANEIAGECFGVGLEFETQRSEDGILELRAPDFDDVVHAGPRLPQRELERLQRGQEFLDLAMERNAESRRTDVIRRLLIIDVIERRNARIVPQRFMEHLQSAVRNHLVDIHIEGCSGSPLEGIDDDVVIELPIAHLPACLQNGIGLLGVILPCAEFSGSRGTREFDVSHGMNPSSVDMPPRDFEIIEASCGMDAPKSIRRNAKFTDEIVFCSEFHIIQSLWSKKALCCLLSPILPSMTNMTTQQG